MYLIDILGIVHPCARLDDIHPERACDAICLQILFSGCRRGLGQTNVVYRLRQILERKMWLSIHLEEGSNRLLHQLLCPDGSQAIFPEYLRCSPPATLAPHEDPVLSIVDTQRIRQVLNLRLESLGSQTEFSSCRDKILIHLHEDASAKLNRLRRVIVHIDSSRSSSDIARALVDSDVDLAARMLEAIQIVGGRSTTGTSSDYGHALYRFIGVTLVYFGVWKSRNNPFCI